MKLLLSFPLVSVSRLLKLSKSRSSNFAKSLDHRKPGKTKIRKTEKTSYQVQCRTQLSRTSVRFSINLIPSFAYGPRMLPSAVDYLELFCSVQHFPSNSHTPQSRQILEDAWVEEELNHHITDKKQKMSNVNLDTKSELSGLRIEREQDLKKLRPSSNHLAYNDNRYSQ